MRSYKLAPSLLSADFGCLAEQIRDAEAAGVDYIHVDVMDGQFVPNITIGPLIVKAARAATSLPLDVHLMIVQPERYLADFARAGADILTIHPEATPHAHRALQHIRELGCKAGMAINPLTPNEYLRDALPYLDLALIMSVNPGFGGQSFIESSLGKIAQLRAWRDTINPACEIEVDGGVKTQNIRSIAEAGVDVFVAGSAIFNSAGIGENVRSMRLALENRSDAL